jgi:glycolate oxidase FAD binding subunit
MELIHPYTKGDVLEAVRDANGRAERLLVVGGRQHMDRGNPCEVDAELWTTQLDGLVSYEPEEMIAVVEAGMRVGDLNRTLAEGGQEWPCDAPEEATVGGVIASACSSPRRLKVGRLADTVLETEVVTGDGRLVRSGARTVKDTSGYALHRLIAGSLGTLGVIVQVALKVRPLPEACRTLHAPGGVGIGAELLRRVPSAAGVAATPGEVEVRLEGWREEVEEQTEAAREVVPGLEAVDGGPFPSHRPWEEAPVVVEAAVPPSELEALSASAETGERWGALLGVGLLWVGLDGSEGLEALRGQVAELGGIAPAIRGPGGLGDAPLPAESIHRRLKETFDPNGVLAPGRGWGGL